MHASLKEKLAGYGQWTYRGAWALEILAAAIGLATGLALGWQAYASAAQGVTSVDLVLASAPFFMVAIAELTKIPIATLLFAARWPWKPVVALFLLLIAGITFETVFMGLERAATLRQLRYETIADDMQKRRFESGQLDARILDAERTDDVALAKGRLDALTAAADKARADEAARLQAAEKELEGNRVLTPEAALARDRLADATAERDRVVAERDGRIREAVDEFERQRDSFVQRIDQATAAGDGAARARYQDELARLSNPRPRITAEYGERVAAAEGEVAALRADYDRLRASAPPMSPEERARIEARRDEARARADAVEADWAAQLARARAEVDEAQVREADEARRLAADRDRKAAVATELADLEKSRIELARTDQVRRIAGRVYGLQPEEVTEEQAGVVSVVWFGSLAGLAALAGPVTAMVALGLQRVGEPPGRPGPLARLARRMLLSWRWRRTRAVPVTVEVPVDREVERRVEVPVEKVVKEIVYVPVLTDDPEAVRRIMNDNLPPEVASLVSVSLAGVGHGGASQHVAPGAGGPPRAGEGVAADPAG